MRRFGIPFFLILALVFLGIDFYAFQGVRVITADWRMSIRKAIFIAYWAVSVLAIAFLVVAALSDFTNWPRALRIYLPALIFSLYLTKLLVVPFMLVDDLIRVGKWVSHKFSHTPDHEPISDTNRIRRSEFISTAAWIFALIPFSGLIYGMVYGGFDYIVRRRTIRYANLPAAFDGLRILQVSDIHTGSFVSTHPLERAVKMINEQKADIVFFTGDLVNSETQEVLPHIDALKQIKAPMGVYSILGNHDYGDYVEWPTPEDKVNNFNHLLQVHRGLGWELLRNENRVLERQGQQIGLAGVENWGAFKHFPKYGDLDQAMKGIESMPFTILLSHDPTHWDAKVLPSQYKIDLMLAGHTHGTQFGIETKWFRWSPAEYVYKQWAGLYRQGSQYLYVNRGLGLLGFPGRTGMRPEITVLELRKA